MKTQILILVCTLSGIIARANVKYDLNDAPALFENYIKQFNKTYMSDEDREAHFKAFKMNLELYNEYNMRFEFPLFCNDCSDFTEIDWELLLPKEEINKPNIPKLPAKYHKPYFKKEEYPELFEALIKVYDKKYKDEEEKQMRYKYFVRHIDNLNKRNKLMSYKSRVFKIIDETFDFTDEELVKHRKGNKKLKSSKTELLPSPPLLYRKKAYNIDKAPKLFDKYWNKFKKRSSIDISNEGEKRKRLDIFKDNLKLINELNEYFVAPFRVTESVFFTEDERRQRRQNRKLKRPQQDSSDDDDDDDDNFTDFEYIPPNKIPIAESDSDYDYEDYFDDVNYEPLEIPKLPFSAPRPAVNSSEHEYLKPRSHQTAATMDKLQKWADEVLKWTTIKPRSAGKTPKPWLSGTDKEDLDKWMERQLDEITDEFNEFTKHFNKTYKDERDRQKHFKEFYEYIKNMNWCNEHFSDAFYINKFADATREELSDFVVYRKNRKGNKPKDSRGNKKKQDVYIHWQRR